MTEAENIEKLAKDLRAAAFPGASSWAFCSGDVRERWISAARVAAARATGAADDALRRATASLHAAGENTAVRYVRELRNRL